MEWVHCNNCFILPGGGKRFHLTSCGHIYCTDCTGQCAKERCKLCGSQCTTIPLSSQMKPDVEMYFTDPVDLLKKHLKQIQQVAEFQHSHRTRLFTHQKEQIIKLQALKEDFKKAVVKLKELDGERVKLKKENDYLKKIFNVNCRLTPEMSGTPGIRSSHSTPQHLYKGDAMNMPFEPSHKSSRLPSSAPNSRTSAGTSKSSPSHPAMPARVTVRTPPVNGRMGVIPGTPSTPQMSSITLRNLKLSGQTPDSQTTPKVMNGIFISPMSISPCSSQASNGSSRGFSLASPACHTPLSGQSTPPSSSVSDYRKSQGTSGNRQIKLPYEMQNFGFVRKVAVSPYSPKEENNEHQ